ncbi:MAG: hypothetical protein B7X40_03575 [Cellulomonas sp. 14-74-6]|nr:MAG: hypothetical protein B7X40_03575 [Cellulomonas sp. 14-74-6]
MWAVLVVATLVGAAFLARSLWRRGLALGRAVGGAAEATAGAADRGTERADQLRAAHPVPGPALGTDPAVLRDRLAQVRAERARRRAVRADRHRRTYETWRQVWR